MTQKCEAKIGRANQPGCFLKSRPGCGAASLEFLARDGFKTIDNRDETNES